MVDIPLTIEQMQASGVLQTKRIAYMQKKYLQKYQTTITSTRMINKRGGVGAIANITLPESQGINTPVFAVGEAGVRK